MAAADTAKLVASLTLDAKGFTRAVSKAQKDLGKLESTAFRVGQNIGGGIKAGAANIAKIGVVVLGALGTQVVAGVRSLEDLETAMNATAGVIKSTGGAAGVTAQQVRDLANSLEEVTTVDDKTIQQGENLLLTFTNIGKDVFPQATKSMVDLAVAMNNGKAEGADLSASAIQIGKALNDPIAGITALKKAGVSFTKQQKDQIKALQESGDVVGAQTIILNELEKEFGEAGKAAGTGFGADMRRVGDAVETAQQALAVGFLPVISKVAKILNEKLSDPTVLANIRKLGEELAGSLDSLINVASRLPWGAIGDSLKIAGAGAKAVLNAFVSLPPWVQTAVLTGWGLNKLTGGALGGIVGELGKGLIKGVLGINAAQVNIKAATVTGVGGGTVPAGASVGKSKIGAAASAIGKVFIVGAAAGAFIELAQILGQQSEQNRGLEEGLAKQTQKFTGGASLADLKTSLAGVDAQIYNLQYGSKALTAEGIAYALNIDGVRTAVEQSRADLVSAIGRAEGQAAQHNQQIVDGIHSQSAQAQQLAAHQQAAAFAVRDAVNTKGGLVAQVTATVKGAVDATRAAAASAGQQTAAAIRDKDLSVKVQNFNTVTTTVSVKDTIKATQKYHSVYRVAS